MRGVCRKDEGIVFCRQDTALGVVCTKSRNTKASGPVNQANGNMSKHVTAVAALNLQLNQSPIQRNIYLILNRFAVNPQGVRSHFLTASRRVCLLNSALLWKKDVSSMRS